MCRDIFRTIAERQVRGLMFHSDMADYYAFLNMKIFKDFHDKQYLEESKNLRKTKNYFICKKHQTLVLGAFGPSLNIVPVEWEDKTTMDVDKDTGKILLKQSLEKYFSWEDETCEIYKKASEDLFNWGYYEEYCFVRELIDDVEIEKNHITSLMAELSTVDFDYMKIKGLQYKIK